MKNLKRVGLLSAALLPLYWAFGQELPSPPPSPEATLSEQVAAPGQAVVPPANVSPGAAEVIKMASSGVGEEVLIAYVNRSVSPFGLSADTILYLRDLGVSSGVITAMLNRDITLQTQPPGPTSPPPPAPVEQPPPPPSEPPPEEIATAPPEVSYFYDDLAPYGSWVMLSGVGWCWQPRCVTISHGWRPYCDGGHWVNTECGWYWQSDYSWGWAPFHYGRWQMHERCGWVWCPDKVWGPAWVTWRVSGDHCGWAPLPPHAVFVAGSGWRYHGSHVAVGFDFGLHADHFTFVATRDFGHRDLHRVRMPSTEVRNVYSHTTVINNTTVVNNTIVNRGVAPERIEAVTHTRIQRATIREAPAGTRVAASRTIDRGPTPVVYRRDLTGPAKPMRVEAQKVDERHPIVQHPPVVATRNPMPTETSRGTLTRPGTVPRSTQVPRTGSPQSQPDRYTPTVPRNPETPNTPRQPAPTSPSSSPRQPSRGRGFTSEQTPKPEPAHVTVPVVKTTESVSQNRDSAPHEAPVPRVHEPAVTRTPQPSVTSTPERAATRTREPSTPDAGSQNPQVYYPKGHQQSLETRSRPESRATTSSNPRSSGNAGSASRGNSYHSVNSAGTPKGHDK